MGHLAKLEALSGNSLDHSFDGIDGRQLGEDPVGEEEFVHGSIDLLLPALSATAPEAAVASGSGSGSMEGHDFAAIKEMLRRGIDAADDVEEARPLMREMERDFFPPTGGPDFQFVPGSVTSCWFFPPLFDPSAFPSSSESEAHPPFLPCNFQI